MFRNPRFAPGRSGALALPAAGRPGAAAARLHRADRGHGPPWRLPERDRGSEQGRPAGHHRRGHRHEGGALVREPGRGRRHLDQARDGDGRERPDQRRGLRHRCRRHPRSGAGRRLRHRLRQERRHALPALAQGRPHRPVGHEGDRPRADGAPRALGGRGRQGQGAGERAADRARTPSRRTTRTRSASSITAAPDWKRQSRDRRRLWRHSRSVGDAVEQLEVRGAAERQLQRRVRASVPERQLDADQGGGRRSRRLAAERHQRHRPRPRRQGRTLPGRDRAVARQQGGRLPAERQHAGRAR